MGLWWWKTNDYPASEPFEGALSVEKSLEFAREAGAASAIFHQQAVLALFLGSADPNEEVRDGRTESA